jgi:hypothetical protein
VEKPAGGLADALFTAIAVPRRGGMERRSRPTEDHSFHWGWGSLRLRFDPPIEAGEYDLRVEGTFRFEGQPEVIIATSPPVPVSVPASKRAPHDAPEG